MDGGAWQAVVHGVAKSRDTTEQLHFHFSLSCIGEGNGNPLQCSCLENPRDRGVWWATVLWGHTESDTTEVTQQQQEYSNYPYIYSHINWSTFDCFLFCRATVISHVTRYYERNCIQCVMLKNTRVWEPLKKSVYKIKITIYR